MTPKDMPKVMPETLKMTQISIIDRNKVKNSTANDQSGT